MPTSRMPPSLDRILRLVFVTPDMHRVHHSQEHREGNSNFSNMLSVWDRLFGTYVDQPAEDTTASHSGSPSSPIASTSGWTGCWRSHS